MDLLIKGGRVIDPSQGIDKTADIFVKDGVIGGIYNPEEKLPVEASEDVRVVDAEGKWVVPGLIDMHVHFREPGFEYKEDIKSGCAAAAAGGFTTVCCMPNTKPNIDSVETVELIKQKADEACGVRVLAAACITKGQQGVEITDMEALEEAGVCGFSEDGRSVNDINIMREAMRTAKCMNMPIMDHTETEEFSHGGCMHKGRYSELAELAGIPAKAESDMAARDILLAKDIGCDLHLQHISKASSVKVIRLAKSMGIPVTAETAPHYFTLTDADVVVRKEDIDINEEHSYHYDIRQNGFVADTHRKMNPPLGSGGDRHAVISALIDGTIDVIATDHAPHSEEEKARPFDKAPFGVVGLETSFAVSYTELVETEIITPSRLIELMSLNPARIMRCGGGTLGKGRRADIAIIDIEKEYVIDSERFSSKGRNTPFEGKRVRGEVLMTIAAGKIIYEKQQETV